MYSLRKVTKAGTQINEVIGNKYSVVLKGGKSEERFNKELELHKQSSMMPDEPEIFAFITTENLKMIPLYVDEYVYIMTENGSTFDKLQ